MAIDRLFRLCYLSLNFNRNHKGYIYCDLNNLRTQSKILNIFVR